MTDALLVSDQQIDAGLLPEAQSPKIGLSSQSNSQDILALPGPSAFSGNNSFYGEQTLQGYGVIHHQNDRWTNSSVSRLRNREATLASHLWRGKAALEKAATIRENTRKKKLFREELQWLAENRREFLGKWVALQGVDLLAVGATAKEVFSKVADQKTPPLVVRIVDEDLPFAGW